MYYTYIIYNFYKIPGNVSMIHRIFLKASSKSEMCDLKRSLFAWLVCFLRYHIFISTLPRNTYSSKNRYLELDWRRPKISWWLPKRSRDAGRNVRTKKLSSCDNNRMPDGLTPARWVATAEGLMVSFQRSVNKNKTDSEFDFFFLGVFARL